jgi:hypothetical protein
MALDLFAALARPDPSSAVTPNCHSPAALRNFRENPQAGLDSYYACAYTHLRNEDQATNKETTMKIKNLIRGGIILSLTALSITLTLCGQWQAGAAVQAPATLMVLGVI